MVECSRNSYRAQNNRKYGSPVTETLQRFVRLWEKRYSRSTGILRIIHARSFTVLIEMVHRITAVVQGQNRTFFLSTTVFRPT